jgi:hypothetical protein
MKALLNLPKITIVILLPLFSDLNNPAMLHSIQVFLILTSSLFIMSCEDKPKIIVEDIQTNGSETSLTASGDASAGAAGAGQGASEVHQVMAHDILQAERYTYLQVSEAGRKFWIATSKMEAEKGKLYLYRGGLMKTNFESLEFNRTFDTIFLVGNVIDASAHPGGNISQAGMTVNPDAPAGSNQPGQVADNSKNAANAIKLAALFKNKEKYADQVITVSGECVKVNNGIMGRNWIHIRDGSKLDGKPLDLTVTSKLSIPVGQKVTLSGKIAVNKDFGAGYRYDIIMEDAQN